MSTVTELCFRSKYTTTTSNSIDDNLVVNENMEELLKEIEAELAATEKTTAESAS